ncbi:MAG: hypothetical protein ACTSUT_08530 [Promethearchaeota archaeon]
MIGASDSFKFGYETAKYLLDSKFKSYPININKEIIKLKFFLILY